MKNETQNSQKTLTSGAEIVLPESTLYPLEAQAKEMLAGIKEILELDGEPTKEQCKLARETRIAVGKLRVALDKERKRCGEYYYNAKKAIDTRIGSFIEEEITPKEEKLEKIERHFEIKQAEINRKIQADRQALLQQYTDQPVSIDTLFQMTDEAFNMLVDGAKHAKKHREETARLIAEAQELKRKEEAAEQERIRKENEVQRQKIAELEAKAKKDREAREAVERKERIAREEAERQARAAQEELEAEKRRIAKIEADKLALEEKKRKEDAAAARKAARAPDKEKLLQFGQSIANVLFPSVKSEEAEAAFERIDTMRSKLIQFIEKEAENL